MEGVKVDPNFVEHFVRNVWLHAQEKQYFEERKKWRTWWWDHTVGLLTWMHAKTLAWGFGLTICSLILLHLQIMMLWIFYIIMTQTMCYWGRVVERECNHTEMCFSDRLTTFTYQNDTSWLVVKSIDQQASFTFYAIGAFWRNLTLSQKNDPVLSPLGVMCRE